MAAAEVVASYKKLGLVEEAFRSLKTVQLEVRPVQWHLKRRLEPFFAADGTHKDRQWTIRNVIELMPHTSRLEREAKQRRLENLCLELLPHYPRRFWNKRQ